MARKRERSDIVLDMLLSIQEKGGRIKPTHLMYKANLAHKQMKTYLEELVEKNFVKKIKDNNYEYITITETGMKFVKTIRQMKEFEKTFGL
ncbi:transcriptional regulator [Candidatus Woesearchaeota archaeon]|nr:MAG: transcriptional regulator [Candidatus Woesearchaeota archaeon]